MPGSLERGGRTLTVTLGPFFFSSAVEGPGNSKKTTEPTTRAAAKRTFMFRSEMRSIHRERRAGLEKPKAGRRWRHGGWDTSAATRGAAGRGGRGSFRPLRRRRASFPPSGSAPGSRSPRGAEPRSLTGRAETRARGWLPRYSGLMGSPARPPTGRGSAEGGAHSKRTRIGFPKRLQTPVCRAAHPGTVCFCGSGNLPADTLLGSPR